MKKKKDFMYYRYLTRKRKSVRGLPKGFWTEFHLGWDKEKVKNGESLSKAIWLGENSYAIGHFLEQCEEKIDLYNMQRTGA